ncbi:hypothetical protein T07_13019 [Trichinella nelsoni]|uniref:Uncharacterized protein n=1 Tax=Trichinella nelsoni TaxID=6336 RepID=A0A0V0RH25_9BILA|nr:hypothetical protein T07_2556 [Trichinella nelsoni]KRX13757.1 hypothetical protein T07_13019 [Trichinella nelsoni]
MLDMRIDKQNCFNIARCYCCGIRGCRGKLYTNLDATQVIRTCEHADGWRVDPHTLYHQQQLSELKRLAAGCLRPVKEIYEELASSLLQLRCCRIFSIIGPGPEHNVLQPCPEISTTSSQTAGSVAYC